MLGVLAACSLRALLAAEPAPNPSTAVELDWRAPQTCPSGDAVQREVIGLLSEAGARPASVARARGRVTMNDAGMWTVKLTLDIQGEATERRISGSSCAELSSAAAFIIATAIDFRVASLPPPRPPGAPVPTRPSTEPSPTEPSPTEPTSSDSRTNGRRAGPRTSRDDRRDGEPAAPNSTRVRVAPGLLAGVGFGPNPTVGAVIGASFAILGRAWRSDLAAQYWTPSDARATSAANARIRVQAWDIVVRGCWVPGWQRWEFPLCGGMASGAMHGRGSGDDVSGKSATGAWFRALAGPGATLRLGQRLALGATVHGYATLATSAFSTEPSGLARHQPRAAGVSGTIRVELRLR